eukprot:scaffold227794_cov19-Tisochrysis_lutea.AAC.1
MDARGCLCAQVLCELGSGGGARVTVPCSQATHPLPGLRRAGARCAEYDCRLLMPLASLPPPGLAAQLIVAIFAHCL